jgi:hypothetical protein
MDVLQSITLPPHTPMHSTIFETQDLELGECVWKYLEMRYLGYFLNQ